MLCDGHFLNRAADNIRTDDSKIINDESFSTNSDLHHIMRWLVLVWRTSWPTKFKITGNGHHWNNEINNFGTNYSKIINEDDFRLNEKNAIQ